MKANLLKGLRCHVHQLHPTRDFPIIETFGQYREAGPSRAGKRAKREPQAWRHSRRHVHTIGLAHLEPRVSATAAGGIRLRCDESGVLSTLGVIVDECLRSRAEIVVVSTVNGHGRTEARTVIEALRAEEQLAMTRVVLGGKLVTDPARAQEAAAELTGQGYDCVFVGDDSATRFREYLGQILQRIVACAS